MRIFSQDRYKNIIGEWNENKPLIYVKEKELLYFQKYFENERIVKENIYRRFNLPEVLGGENIEKLRNFLIDDSGLDELQKAAIFLGVTKPFLINSGGPGTGKTTIIKHIVNYLIEIENYNASKIAITTPTGKAAERIKEMFKTQKVSNGIEISTIHRLLKYNFFTESFFYNKNNKLPHKTIILDEVSMVDIILLRHLLEAVSFNTRLIIIGDKDQLPPVGAGAFISRLIPPNFTNKFSLKLQGIINESLIDRNAKDNVVLLQRSFRSVQEIISVSNSVNNGVCDIGIQEVKKQKLKEIFSMDSFMVEADRGWFIL